jgi:hypothetical protein
MLRQNKKESRLVEERRVHSTLMLKNIQSPQEGGGRPGGSDRTAYDTLRLLQRVIIRQQLAREPREEMELQASRLPMLPKQEGRRQRVAPQYDPKYKW